MAFRSREGAFYKPLDPRTGAPFAETSRGDERKEVKSMAAARAVGAFVMALLSYADAALLLDGVTP